MKKAIVTSSTQDKDKDTANSLTVPPATDVARKSKSDIFENTGVQAPNIVTIVNIIGFYAKLLADLVAALSSECRLQIIDLYLCY